MKILHLLHDDKFTDYVVKLFETCMPGENIYLLGFTNSNQTLKHTRSPQIITAVYNTDAYWSKLQQVEPGIVFVHFLDSFKASVVQKLSPEIKKVWLVWGGDFYESGLYSGNIYDRLTLNLMLKFKWHCTAPGLYQKIRFFYHRYIKRTPATLQKKTHPALLPAATRFDYAATVIPAEYPLLYQIPGFKAEQLYFSYGTIDTLVYDRNAYVDHNSTQVLIGNSNNPSANHLDVFRQLKKIGNIDNIVVPLNYGGIPEYQQVIVNTGKKVFQNRFLPLTDFLSLQAYNRILQSCRIAVFAHTRQQALGNIIAALYMGAKVFLSEESVVYTHFKNKGVLIFSVQKDLHENNFQPFTSTEIEHNRKILEQEYNFDHVASKVSEVLACLQKPLSLPLSS